MKQRLVILAVIVTAFGGVLVGLAQPNEPDCRQSVLAIFNRVSTAMRSTHPCKLDYTIRTVSAVKGRDVVHEANYSVVAREGAVRIVGTDLEHYQDAAIAATVMRAQHLIVLQRAAPGGESVGQATMLDVLRDSMLASSTVMDCGRVDEVKLGADHRATFRLASRAEQLLGVRTITVLYDESKNLLRRVTMTFAPGQRTRTIEMTYTNTDFDYAAPVLDTDAIAMVCDAKGQPLPRYGGYRVYDLRAAKH